VAEYAPTVLSLAYRGTGAAIRVRMLAHPSGSASPNLPSEAKLIRRISRQSKDCLRARLARAAAEEVLLDAIHGGQGGFMQV